MEEKEKVEVGNSSKKLHFNRNLVTGMALAGAVASVSMLNANHVHAQEEIPVTDIETSVDDKQIGSESIVEDISNKIDTLEKSVATEEASLVNDSTGHETVEAHRPEPAIVEENSDSANREESLPASLEEDEDSRADMEVKPQVEDEITEKNPKTEISGEGSVTEESTDEAIHTETSTSLESAAKSVENQTVVIGNKKFERVFEVKDGKLRTLKLVNKEDKSEIVFDEASDEFVIQLVKDGVATTQPVADYIPFSNEDRSKWIVTATSTSSQEGPNSGKIEAAFDGKLDTHWHTNYGNGTGNLRTLPESVEIAFPEAKDFKTFIYVPRQNAQNGNVKDFDIFIKKTNESEFTVLKSGTLDYSRPEAQLISLDGAGTFTALKFTAKTAKNGQPFAAAAEFDFSMKTLSELQKEMEIRRAEERAKEKAAARPHQITLGELTLKENGIKETNDEKGSRVVFSFQGIDKHNSIFDVDYVVEVGGDDNFSNSHLKFKITDNTDAKAKIASIDLQSFQLNKEETIWKLPPQAPISEMANFNGFYAGLGQPVYVGSFFTGSTFPVAWNTVDEDNILFSRYYSGKSFDQLEKDEDGYFRTWDTVVGTAASDNFDTVQKAFYDYLGKIGQKTYYRKQYNSWFDHMQGITAENIQKSFYEIENGFTSKGVAPLDSFVVDDGWQKQNSLWEFNSKFPNKLYDSSKQVGRLGSNFGLWVGPQGGYAEPHVMANALAASGQGSAHAGVVYIGDKRYVDGIDKVFRNYNKDFDINYWKLDGLLLHPQSNTTEHFIGGGYLNMYAMTETHERWIGLYDSIRETSGDDMWINLTSYIAPSPWYLQWVNSIWMQNAADVDYEDRVKGAGKAHLDFGSDVNESITYRDDRYEELVKLRQWQLPFANIYNHDPVYGKTQHLGKGGQQPIRFSPEDLRTYLYMLGTRGTGFWEFYYSYELFSDEHWDVNGEAVTWIEDNYDTLKNAKMHGGKPGNGEVYGYSAWTPDSGIISIRNPIQTTASYQLVLDEAAGLTKDMSGYYQTIVLGDKKHDSTISFNYGDRITLDLQAYETVIFQYAKKQDKNAAKVITAKTTAANKIEITFDEQVLKDGAAFKVNGKTVTDIKQKTNLRTFELTLDSDLNHYDNVLVEFENVKDNAAQANLSTGTANLQHYTDGKVLDIKTIKAERTLVDAGIVGSGAFSVTLKGNLTSLNQVLAQQGDEWKLSVDETGRVVFQVKDLKVVSSPYTELNANDRGTADKLIEINEDFVVTAVRNENGSLRLFLDGAVNNTAYESEKVNESLKKATISFGNKSLKGTLSNFVLENFARNYKTSEDIAKPLLPVKTDGFAIVEGLTAQATSYDPNDGGPKTSF